MLTVLGLGLIIFALTIYYPLNAASLLNKIAFLLMDLAYEIRNQEERGSFKQIRDQVTKSKENIKSRFKQPTTKDYL